MAHAERIKGVLVVQHTDRLARGDGVKARHLIELYLWAAKAGVTLRSVQDDATCENLIMAAVMGERNAEDSRRKSLAVAAGMKRCAESGKRGGGPRPYGYRHGPDGLKVVPAEAETVRRIFAEFTAGRSLSAIARDLYRDRVPTVRAARWHQSTLGGILSNPLYAGRLRHHDEVFEGSHEPLIDADTWQHAADILAARPTRGRGRPPKGRHLFRGGLLRSSAAKR